MQNQDEINGSIILGELDRMIENASNNGNDVERLQFIVLRQIYVDLRKLRKTVYRNPMFLLGNAIRLHPGTTLTVFLIVTALLNLWLVSGFRETILSWLGIPPGLIP